MGLIGSFFYFGMTIGCLSVNINDHLGWWMSMIIASALTMIANYFLFFFTSLTMRYFSMFLLGLSLEFSWIISYTLALEIAPKKYHSFNNGAINIMDMGFNMILPTLFIKYVSWHLNYYYFQVLIVCPLCLVLCYWFPESPRYLHGKWMFSECKSNLFYIASVNKSNFNKDIEFIEELHSLDDQPHTSIKKMLSDKVIFRNFIIMIYIYCAI